MTAYEYAQRLQEIAIRRFTRELSWPEFEEELRKEWAQIEAAGLRGEVHALISPEHKP